MHYIVIGRDAHTEDALERRMAVRHEHIDYAKPYFKAKTITYACALLEQGRMVGSVIILSVKDKSELDDYLRDEPYVKHNIWVDIEIKEIAVPDALLNLDA